MPYKNPELKKYSDRCAQRTHRHGNWRQTYIDCGGICTICGEVETLEFHEPFGEDHNGEGKMQKRILLCFDCHCQEHDQDPYVGQLNRKYISQLQQDIDFEITRCGNREAWIRRYNLVDQILIERRDLND